MNGQPRLPEQLREILKRNFKKEEKWKLFKKGLFSYVEKRDNTIKTIKEINSLNVVKKGNYNIGFCFDGSFLPIRHGASYTIANLMNSLSKRHLSTNLILCYRGWDNPKLYFNKDFRTIFMNPDDYYGQDGDLERILKSFGMKVVHLYSSETVINLSSRLKKIGVKVIFEIQNIDYILFKSLKYKKIKIINAKKLQSRALKLSDYVLCRSEIDQFYAMQLGAKKDTIAVYKGGINVDDFQFKLRNSKRYKIVFLGHMYYPPNENALGDITNKILPYLDRKFEITVIGITPTKTVKKYRNSRLIFKQGVDNLSKELLNYDIAIAPLTAGSGTRLKILDYLASGLPVVSTSLAIEGLDSKMRDLVTIENNLDLYANRIKAIINNLEVYGRRAKEARKFVKQEYDWSKCVGTFLKTYKFLLNGYKES